MGVKGEASDHEPRLEVAIGAVQPGDDRLHLFMGIRARKHLGLEAARQQGPDLFPPLVVVVPRPLFPDQAAAPRSGSSDAPEPAPPFRLDRHGELRQVAPFAVHEVVHALHAALLVGAIRMVHEAADHELAFQVVWVELPELEQDVAELLVGLRKGLDLAS